MKANDPKLTVLERLHGMAQMIRRRGTSEEAAAAVPYEQQFAREMEELKRQQELALSHVEQTKAGQPEVERAAA